MLKSARLILVGLYVLATSFLGTLLCLLRPFHPDNSRLMGRVIGHPVLKMLGIDFEIEGHDILVENRPGIFISNHQHTIDIFCCGAIIPKRTVSLGKKSLRWIPFFGQMYWLTGNVLIDRGHKRKAYGTMDKAVEAVTQKNTTIWMMPEGTRNKSNLVVAPFKKGVFYAAIKSGRPLTLICFNRYFKEIDLNKWAAGKIRMKVLAPIDTKEWKDDQVAELAEHCHQLILAEVKNL